MDGLIEGRTAQAVLLIVVLLAIYETSRIASRRKLRTRGIPGLEKLNGWIQEAARLNRPVFFSPGTGSVTFPDTLAALALLEYVAQRCAEHNVRIIVANADLNVQQVSEDIVKTAYAKAGKEGNLAHDAVRYISGRQFAFAAGVMGILRRERPAVNFFVGDFSAEALEIAEAGRTEAIAQFGGTSNVDQLPFFMATCDQTLIGEELYTAQGYLSSDPRAISNIVGPDAGKILAILVVLLGVLLATAGSSILVDLLSL
jgi:hypothetical protein